MSAFSVSKLILKIDYNKLFKRLVKIVLVKKPRNNEWLRVNILYRN